MLLCYLLPVGLLIIIVSRYQLKLNEFMLTSAAGANQGSLPPLFTPDPVDSTDAGVVQPDGFTQPKFFTQCGGLTVVYNCLLCKVFLHAQGLSCRPLTPATSAVDETVPDKRTSFISDSKCKRNNQRCCPVTSQRKRFCYSEK